MRCPFAEWKPLTENGTQSRIVPSQVIFHSLTSPSAANSWRYFEAAPVDTESTFLMEYDGHLIQALDTEVRADAQWDANARAVSVETASNGGATDPWTPAQAAALVRLSSWLMAVHPRIKPVRCATWSAPGFGYHRLFPEWNHNGHTCPGDLRVKQFPMILDAIAHPQPKPPPTPTPIPVPEADVLIATQLLPNVNPSYWLLTPNCQLVNVHPADPKPAVTLTEQADWDRLVKVCGPPITA